jgi:hypothetical protein
MNILTIKKIIKELGLLKLPIAKQEKKDSQLFCLILIKNNRELI